MSSAQHADTPDRNNCNQSVCSRRRELRDGRIQVHFSIVTDEKPSVDNANPTRLQLTLRVQALRALSHAGPRGRADSTTVLRKKQHRVEKRPGGFYRPEADVGWPRPSAWCRSMVGGPCYLGLVPGQRPCFSSVTPERCKQMSEVVGSNLGSRAAILLRPFACRTVVGAKDQIQNR